MSAPYLGGKWQEKLRSLDSGWDSYGAPPIDPRAIDSVEKMYVVPCSSGGVQLEVHRDGWDIEIEFRPDGTIKSVLICQEPPA